jgi:2-phosphosulfolactate phosphatase
MRIGRATLETCAKADGTVVVIDVLRAFTTACFAFKSGVAEIVLASTVEEAFALRSRFLGSLIAGEVDGYPVEGFDLGNSPSQLAKRDLRGLRLIQRTTAGSQGATRSVQAKRLLAACLCNLSATASALGEGTEEDVTLLTTGVFPGGWGDEDVACADCLEALLEERQPDFPLVSDRVRGSRSGLHYVDPLSAVFPPEDLELALSIDCFASPLEIVRHDGLLIMRPGELPGSPTTR